MSGTITLTSQDFARLCEDQFTLTVLKAFGVEHWEGWAAAMEAIRVAKENEQ